jgi:sugar phosphate isomerase/epimerase
MTPAEMTRRDFLALAGAAPLALGLQEPRTVPVGIELYSVRGELVRDLEGTVRAVAGMGYEVVEFYSPYYEWTPEYARSVRSLMDDLGIRCLSTHNGANAFTPDGLRKAIDLNQIIGSRSIVMASAGRVAGIDGWRGVADRLNQAARTLGPLGMRAGFHNHAAEWAEVDGEVVMEVLAAGTGRDVALQLDVGTCVAAGADPVAWIRRNPGRITSVHCKDWGPGEGPNAGYRVLFGDGASPWLDIFEAAESVGGVEYYLIEQEGSRFPELETAERCLATYREMRGI